jgi:hypothetical protein
MSIFMAELYVARTGADTVERAAERSRLAAEQLTRDGFPIRHLRWMFVPEDETCFLLYEAASADAVREVGQRAALIFERIAETVEE